MPECREHFLFGTLSKTAVSRRGMAVICSDAHQPGSTMVISVLIGLPHSGQGYSLGQA